MEGKGEIPIGGWRAWSSAVALLAAGWIALVILTLQVRPGATVVAVAFPPWWSTQQVFEAAGSAKAAIVRATALPTLLVVRPDDHDGLARLHDAGAWLVMDAQAVSACFGR
jgi:hypothetical protein